MHGLHIGYHGHQGNYDLHECGMYDYPVGMYHNSVNFNLYYTYIYPIAKVIMLGAIDEINYMCFSGNSFCSDFCYKCGSRAGYISTSRPYNTRFAKSINVPAFQIANSNINFKGIAIFSQSRRGNSFSGCNAILPYIIGTFCNGFRSY